MFLSTVVVGSSHYCNPDSKIRLPPVKQRATSNKDFATERYVIIRRRCNEVLLFFFYSYDSVSGKTGGSVVYIVYANSKAYPSYLITYV